MELHAVQREALIRSAGKEGFGYFMEQGLGKTLTTYTDFMDRVAERKATRMVVICPNSFKGGWVEEATKYDINVDAHVFESGSNANRYFIRKDFNRPPVLIVNYEAIRSASVQDMILDFVSRRPGFITFDESVQLKTHNSQQTKAAINLSKNFSFSRILSGKPITQGPHDLWGQMRAIRQLEGKNYYAFKTMFCKMGGFRMKQVVGAQNEEYLAKLIDPHVFRATKAGWTDLPPKMYTIRDYEMTAEMRTMYRSMENDFVLWLNSGEVVTVDIALTKYAKLAQIQCGFIIREDGGVEELVPPERNPRLRLLREILDTEVVGKATIVYNHRYTFEILSRALADLNPAYIRGQMNSDEIESQKRRFNNDPNCRVILLQTKAAKYGHTLLGDQSRPDTTCSTSIVFENTYSLDDRSQIEDRIHRHGQKAEMVLYIDLIGTPLDRNAVRALQRKEDVFQSVFRHIGSG